MPVELYLRTTPYIDLDRAPPAVDEPGPPSTPCPTDGFDPSTLGTPSTPGGAAARPPTPEEEVDAWLRWLNDAGYEEIAAAFDDIPEEVFASERFSMKLGMKLSEHARKVEARTWILKAEEQIWQAISRWA
jgi:hypothetical protein